MLFQGGFLKWVVVAITIIAFGLSYYFAAAVGMVIIPFSEEAGVETIPVAASYLSSYFSAAAAGADAQSASLNLLEKSFTYLGEAFFFCQIRKYFIKIPHIIFLRCIFYEQSYFLCLKDNLGIYSHSVLLNAV